MPNKKRFPFKACESRGLTARPVIQSLLFIKIGVNNGRTKNTQAMATYKIQSRVA